MGTILALLARHLLTGVGAALVAHGMNATDANTLIGAASIVGGLVWSWYQKHASGALKDSSQQ